MAKFFLKLAIIFRPMGGGGGVSSAPHDPHLDPPLGYGSRSVCLCTCICLLGQTKLMVCFTDLAIYIPCQQLDNGIYLSKHYHCCSLFGSGFIILSR